MKNNIIQKCFISDLPLSFNINKLPEPPKNIIKKHGSGFWVYGDSVSLKIILLNNNFDKNGNFIEFVSDDFKKFENKEIIVTIYDFHFDVVLTKSLFYEDIIVKDACIYLDIDSETSKELFPKGVYYLGVILKKMPNEEGVINNIYFDDDVNINSNLIARKQLFIPSSTIKEDLDDEIYDYYNHYVEIQDDFGETILETIIIPEDYVIEVK